MPFFPLVVCGEEKLILKKIFFMEKVKYGVLDHISAASRPYLA
jgi:hypothetical protein